MPTPASVSAPDGPLGPDAAQTHAALLSELHEYVVSRQFERWGHPDEIDPRASRSLLELVRPYGYSQCKQGGSRLVALHPRSPWVVKVGAGRWARARRAHEMQMFAALGRALPAHVPATTLLTADVALQERLTIDDVRSLAALPDIQRALTAAGFQVYDLSSYNVGWRGPTWVLLDAEEAAPTDRARRRLWSTRAGAASPADPAATPARSDAAARAPRSIAPCPSTPEPPMSYLLRGQFPTPSGETAEQFVSFFSTRPTMEYPDAIQCTSVSTAERLARRVLADNPTVPAITIIGDYGLTSEHEASTIARPAAAPRPALA